MFTPAQIKHLISQGETTTVQFKIRSEDAYKMGVEMVDIELADYRPSRPYKVDFQYFRDCRKEFTTEEWLDVVLA